MIKKQAKTNRQRKAVYKTRNSLGFTMAELLIVVAIIGVLSAVSFVAVHTHQKNLSQAELDAIAKQIYVAAQNHLIMAENENYLGSTDFGTPLDTDHGGTDQDAKNGIYYFTSDQFSSDNNLLDQMLPFGALDETVRAGGNYIIFYQPESATVLDVFYAKDACTFNGATRAGFGGTDKKNTRRDNNPMMGWYGGYDNSDANAANGVADLRQGSELKEPTIVVENAEKLKVFVNDPNGAVSDTGFVFQLIISGLNPDGTETGAKAAIPLRDLRPSPSLSSERVTFPTEGKYEVVLDDVTYDATDADKTKQLHFADIVKGNTTEAGFVPGQNISIQAIAYNTELRSNIASSNVEITNSLFERISEDGSIAYINNIRHLENLEESISGLNKEVYNPGQAVQTSDMSWQSFTNAVSGTPSNVCVRTWGSSPVFSEAGCYMPVSPGYVLDYDGKNYNISDVKANWAGDAGLFGTLAAGSKVSNLALIDFDITASAGNAGALAGSITGTDVTNVLAYDKNTPATATNVTAANGSAGGLIGEMSDGAVSKCAAALIVSGKDAGGLIGKATGGTVTASYSGGHTTDALYTGTYEGTPPSPSSFNVTGTGDAGGLIGNAGSAAITYCYSTCSAAGATAGGLVGEASGNISHSYATGLVRSTAGTPVEGAFAGKHESGTLSDNHYFEIINERQETDGGFSYLTALGQDKSDSGITAIDETAATYNAFCWPAEEATWTDDKWAGAMVYDKKLIEYYGVAGDNGRNARYRLKTVAQLGATLKTSAEDTTEYFVTTHYGDWPAPEIFVFNTKASS